VARARFEEILERELAKIREAFPTVALSDITKIAIMQGEYRGLERAKALYQQTIRLDQDDN